MPSSKDGYLNHGPTLPEFVFMKDSGPATESEGPLVWSGQCQPPKIGEVITISVNNIGKASVYSYASHQGYLGVMALPHDPPKWHSGQPALTFGAEILEQRTCDTPT